MQTEVQMIYHFRFYHFQGQILSVVCSLKDYYTCRKGSLLTEISSYDSTKSKNIIIGSINGLNHKCYFHYYDYESNKFELLDQIRIPINSNTRIDKCKLTSLKAFLGLVCQTESNDNVQVIIFRNRPFLYFRF